MPFCPKCKYEFVEGLDKCPDCNTKLVDKIPEEREVIIKWVQLSTLSSPIMAEMVKETLKNHGIQSFIKMDVLNAAFLAKGTSTAGSFAKIFVPEEDKESAKEILKSISDNK
ncbi:MAG: hypothetical protein DRP89_04240 [Candidatus Neomarinimicrobiota bacterium]|nr:MAG: hypothetical protein DRP89_04240 [Candidatus Neomarinimicrobiota bacterium]